MVGRRSGVCGWWGSGDAGERSFVRWCSERWGRTMGGLGQMLGWLGDGGSSERAGNEVEKLVGGPLVGDASCVKRRCRSDGWKERLARCASDDGTQERTGGGGQRRRWSWSVVKMCAGQRAADGGRTVRNTGGARRAAFALLGPQREAAKPTAHVLLRVSAVDPSPSASVAVSPAIAHALHV